MSKKKKKEPPLPKVSKFLTVYKSNKYKIALFIKMHFKQITTITFYPEVRVCNLKNTRKYEKKLTQ